MFSLAAKYYAVHFIPYRLKVDGSSKKSPSESEASKSKDGASTNFWDVLVKLDNLAVNKKGKSLARSHSSVGTSIPQEEQFNLPFDQSPLGQLVEQLAHPIIKRSSLLTDKLLKLLSTVSSALNPPKASAVTPVTYSISPKYPHTQENMDEMQRLFGLAIGENNYVLFLLFIFHSFLMYSNFVLLL